MTLISFYTLGCRLNQSETSVIERTFDNTQYQIVDFKKSADIAIINTCTVTENGDADTRNLVNRANRLNPNVQIALIGCQAQTQKELLTQLPNIRWVIGNARKIDLAQIIQESRSKKSNSVEVITPPIPRDSFTIPVAGIDRHHTRVNLKVQDGCDFFCSFCEIPYARGRARSREFDDIIKEAKILVDAGHKEIVLTGINIATYKYKNYNLIDIVTALECIENLERIRISSAEPTTIPFGLIEKMAKQTKLCRYLHIPLQSGSNKILIAMKRKYTTEEFGNFIQIAYDTVPEICIGTDVIVGFPGEGDDAFNETFEFLQELPVHYFHVFSYSKRTMAKSKNLSNELPGNTIQKRSKIIRDISLRKKSLFHQSLLGTTQKVLFEQFKNQYWTGLTDNYVRVNVTSSKNLTNKFLNIKIFDLDNQNNVLGKII
ncbi:tRNA t(6)A37-methylthiotransferase [hydrothermal vent metagenome]|uniref:tRNA t(6)A37-methylthiotransferase n=1 Tax=hydrothermal vent metagenome TaxID=652676 RepID=A0A3B0VVP3_9ZZZZ